MWIFVVLIAFLVARRLRAARVRFPAFRTCIGVRRHGPLCMHYPDMPGCDPAPPCPPSLSSDA